MRHALRVMVQKEPLNFHDAIFGLLFDNLGAHPVFVDLQQGIVGIGEDGYIEQQACAGFGPCRDVLRRASINTAAQKERMTLTVT